MLVGWTSRFELGGNPTKRGVDLSRVSPGTFRDPANGDEWLASFQTSLSSVVELRTLTLGLCGYGFDYGLKCELNLHSSLESLPFL